MLELKKKRIINVMDEQWGFALGIEKGKYQV